MPTLMPTLTLLCGLPGSGKTTYARTLEAAGAVRLGPDDWMVPLFGHHMPRKVFDARLDAVKALQWDLATRLLRAGVDVVLDEGFWRRAERFAYREKATALGVPTRLVYFDVPVSVLRTRLAKRGQTMPPGTFEIDDAALALFVSQFEEPGQDEGAEVIRSRESPPLSPLLPR